MRKNRLQSVSGSRKMVKKVVCLAALDYNATQETPHSIRIDYSTIITFPDKSTASTLGILFMDR
jgi:hypothetical protein